MIEIQLYQAIKEMRKISANGGEFSFSFMSLNREEGVSEGIKVVKRARTRPASSTKEVTEADFKLFYQDLEKELPRNCWQPLLMTFNGQRIKLN